MTTTPTTEVAVVEPEFSDAERYALAAFLAGYRGLTRDAYALRGALAKGDDRPWDDRP